MEERDPASSDPGREAISALVRRHAHDVRNGLNGLEIEASLMEVLHGDDKTLASLRRMRNQGAAIEQAMRYFVNRFAEPERRLVPAIDVFQLWRSRSRRLPNAEVTTWTADVDDALISVDSTIVAEALCEALSYTKGSVIEASASRVGAELLFEIRPQSDAPGAANEWPMMDELFAKNGGRRELVTESGRVVARRHWFPLAELSLD